MNINISVAKKEKKYDLYHFGNIVSEFGANSLHFTRNGKPYFPISGEFHFSRYDHNFWRLELLKMKASGLNTVATYLFWNHHEYVQGIFDFSGNLNISKFLGICKELDMQCILRMGPWAHGEARYGGFPPHVQQLAGKRNDSAVYLKYVRLYWDRLYSEVADFCDGKTVLGIQLENEYNGSINHINTLKKLAIDIGFKTPFFTMTAWPTNTVDFGLLAGFGGYPEAPWTFHKHPLSPASRFAICEARTESEIGEDLIKTKRPKVSFDEMPYVGCEVGVGNQVTQHRRPNIGKNDGYGVAFAKYASGMTWMGYYMYHGGRNPNHRLLQESRNTLYPNNYPIIDYDFQSPFGKNGEKNAQCDYLRLLHTFIQTFDNNLLDKNSYFGDARLANHSDNTIPYYCIKSDENLSGYVFISNYERNRNNKDIANFCLSVDNGNKSVSLPSIDIKADNMFFYPFNLDIGGKVVDYILAQPITKIGNQLYFKAIEGITPTISVDGNSTTFDEKFELLLDQKYEIIVLNESKAKQLYLLNNKIYFSPNTLYLDNNKVIEEKLTPVKNNFTLAPIQKVKLPYNHYLFSHGKRHYFKLTIDRELVDKHDDIELKFDFRGLNLQVFSGTQIVDDYFNTDGVYKIRLSHIRQYLKNNQLIIKAVPASFGVGNVYNEINIKPNELSLSLKSVNTIDYVPLKKN